MPSENRPCADRVPPDQIDIFANFRPSPLFRSGSTDPFGHFLGSIFTGKLECSSPFRDLLPEIERYRQKNDIAGKYCISGR